MWNLLLQIRKGYSARCRQRNVHRDTTGRFGRATEFPGRKKHASVYFTLTLCCQNVFPAIIIGKSRFENKTVGQE